MQDKCPACQSPADPEYSQSDITRIDCLRCGRFRIHSTFKAMLNARSRDRVLSDEQLANISGHFRENENQLWTDRDLTMLESLRSPSAREKATKLMRYIRRRCPGGGQQFEIFYSDAEYVLGFINAHRSEREFEGDPQFTSRCQRLLPFIGASWSRDAGDFLFTLNEYVRKGEQWLIGTDNGNNDALFRITPTGWNFLDGLDPSSPESSDAFVAMWFDDETTAAWRDAITPAIQDAGYTALRIDLREHGNHIDDEIIAGIRSSKFLVADLTGHRGGVYWEAGFAFGLAKKVIWTVRKDHLSHVHFDVRQYPFIVWQPDAMSEFRKRLGDRIVAQLGRGSVLH
jgi:hypothetical protein